MPSVISAGTTAGTAITVSGDTTGNLAFQTQAGANTITVPNITGTLITTASTFAGTGPAFSAWQSSGQSLSSGTNTKITFTTEEFDTANCFASSRFTPNVAGYYQFNCGVRADPGSLSALHAKLTKNGTTEFAAGSFTNTSLAAFMSSCSGLIFLNGTTDYVEVFAFSGSSITLSTGSAATYFQGFLARAA